MPIFKWDKVIQKLKQKSHGKTWLKFHLIQIKLSAESCSDSYCISWPGFPTGDRKLLFIEFVNALLSKYAAESRVCERVHPAIDLNSHFLCTRTKLFLAETSATTNILFGIKCHSPSLFDQCPCISRRVCSELPSTHTD